MMFSEEMAHSICKTGKDDILSYSWIPVKLTLIIGYQYFQCEKCNCRICWDDEIKWGVFLDTAGEKSFNVISCSSFEIRDIIL